MTTLLVVSLLAAGLQAVAYSTAFAQAKIAVTSPKEGETMAGPDVKFAIKAKDVKVTDQATKETPKEGHLHVTLDQRPFVAVYGTRFTFKNVPPGDHELKIEPVLSTHMKPIPGASPITVKFKTTAAAPTPKAAPSGTPKITVASPAEGSTLTGNTVTLAVKTENFQITDQGTDPKAKNQGHTHVTLDSRPFVALAKDKFVFKNVPRGEHNLRVEPVSNAHEPTPELAAINVKFTTK